MRELANIAEEWRSVYRSSDFKSGERPLERGFLPVRYRDSSEQLRAARRVFLSVAAHAKRIREEHLREHLGLLTGAESKEIRALRDAQPRPQMPEGATYTTVTGGVATLPCRPVVGRPQSGPAALRSRGSLSPVSARATATVRLASRVVNHSAPIAALERYAFLPVHPRVQGAPKNLVFCLQIEDELAYAYAVDIVSARTRQGAIERFHALHKVQAFGNGYVNKYAITNA